MKKSVYLPLIVPFLLSWFIFTSYENTTYITVNEINQNMIEELISNAIKEKRSISYSSNPYDYVENNQYYNNIVKLGTKAIPILVQMIEVSPHSGLKEYIMAIAVEEIAKVDLKGDNFGWGDAKGFVKKWKIYLKDIPPNVKQIVSSNNNDQSKISQLIKLGTPAIPFILDKIEEGHIEIAPSLNELLKGNETVIFNSSEIKDIKQWAKENKGKFSDLKDLVINELGNAVSFNQ